MNYATIKYCDIANGTGVRTSLFVSGCRHACDGCFNAEAWSFSYGKPYTKEVEDAIAESVKPYYITGLTVLGGEPFEPENQECVLSLIRRIKSESPEKTVWVYSGFTYEELLEGSRAATPLAREILSLADVLVDGRFEKDKKNITLKFRGSENQRLIDLNKTRESGKVITLEDER